MPASWQAESGHLKALSSLSLFHSSLSVSLSLTHTYTLSLSFLSLYTLDSLYSTLMRKALASWSKSGPRIRLLESHTCTSSSQAPPLLSLCLSALARRCLGAGRDMLSGVCAGGAFLEK